MATAAEISEYDTEELERQLGETRRELFNLRFQLATGQLDNFSRINHVRKDVARMMTELRIREIGEAEGLALEDLPGHRAAARRRTEDEALGRDKHHGIGAPGQGQGRGRGRTTGCRSCPTRAPTTRAARRRGRSWLEEVADDARRPSPKTQTQRRRADG